MKFAVICRDKPGHAEVRAANRDAHLAYIDATGVVEQAGPLLDDAEQMIGSLVVLDVKDMGAAQDWADNDPYAKAGLFQSVDLIPWKRVIQR